MSPNERVQRLDADLDLLAARIGGVDNDVEHLRESTTGLTEDVTALAVQVLALTRALGDMAEKLQRSLPKEPVSGTGPGAKDRKVWTASVYEGDEHGVGPVEVLIEQFGDGNPTVAFRREHARVWGRPFRGEVRS